MGKGRPSKYRKRFCAIAYELMKDGYSKENVAAELHINRDTLYEWCKRYPDFSDTIKNGELAGEAYWMRIGKLGTLGLLPNAKPNIWIFIMKNRFKWRN